MVRTTKKVKKLKIKTLGNREEMEFDLPEPISQAKSDIEIMKEAMLTLEDKERDIIAVGTWEKMLAVIKIVKVLGKREIEKDEAMEQLQKESDEWEAKQKAHIKDLS